MGRESPDAAAGDERFRAMERRLSNWSVQVLVLLGVWLLVSLVAPSLTGYEGLAGALGGPDAVTRFFLGFLFLYFAGIVKEKNQLRQTLDGMVVMIREHLEGRARDSAADAAEILIRSLGSEDADTRTKVADRLRTLTGQDLGEDQAAWNSWFEDNKDTLR